MMTNAIVYSSRTGNTKLLADTIRTELADTCIYCGAPCEDALKADRIYIGFWTDKGTCDEQTAAFLQTITNQEVYLFGTAGFGESQEYFDKVLKNTSAHLPQTARVTGSFMCQGKMPMSVRERYVKMMESPSKIPNLQGLIDNFDRARSHPDEKDLAALQQDVRSRK